MNTLVRAWPGAWLPRVSFETLRHSPFLQAAVFPLLVLLAWQILPTLKGQIIAPTTGPTGIDVPAQVAQIQALLDTNSVDCLSIEPPDSNAFTAITNQATAAGIPVFTVGVTSNGNELTNFTQTPSLEGAQAANIVLQWMKDTGKAPNAVN